MAEPENQPLLGTATSARSTNAPKGHRLWIAAGLVSVFGFAAIYFLFLATPSPQSVLRELEQQRIRWNVPGVAVVAVKDFGDTILLNTGLGVRNEAGDPVTSKTLFQIGSTTKAMGAFALLRLAEKGVLDLNGHIKDYRPTFRLSDPSATSLTNFIDLLSHRTGLPRNDLLLFMTNTTIDFLDTKLSEIEPAYEFRSGFGYQNFMHALAGLIGSDLYLNRTSRGPGATFEGWYNMMEKEFFKPLGMEHTTGDVRKWMVDELRANAAPVELDPNTGIPKKVTGWLDPLYSIWLEWASPAGSVTTNVEDLGKYLRFVLKQGINEKGERILSENAFRNAFAPHNSYSADYSKYPPAFSIPYYALGWGVTTYRGKRMVTHSGGTEMTCAVCVFPDDGFGAFIVTNNQAGWASAACPQLADRFLFKDRSTNLFSYVEKATVQQYKDITKAVEKAYADRPKPLPLPSVDPRDFLGTYTSPVWGNVVITEFDPSLQPKMQPNFLVNLMDREHPLSLVQKSGHYVHLESFASLTDSVKPLKIAFASSPYADFLKAHGLKDTIFGSDFVLIHFVGNRYALMGDPDEVIEFIPEAGTQATQIRISTSITGTATFKKVE
ncbi:beta-lactamase/transpeptidase-like protein [Cladochytrium replicatum]|nr:beta-lactamase/transpeptidase-like protein [Cladochytrium replicatum]